MSNTTIYVAIGLSFIINLIIMLSFRAADKRNNNLKRLQQQTKNFRSEVSSTLNRITSTSKDCEQNITSRIEHAASVQEHLAESIDMVLVHQKELDDLSDVCENYGNALKKLKVQTEQAENRIYAVQSEVRKIEAVNEYALQFQKEIERLTAQMGALKADYVRLVASTEQDLKTASQNQKEENNQMLTIFSQSIERAKVQFSDYIADEKRAYDDICREQELTAQNQLDDLSTHFKELEVMLGERREELTSFSASLKADVEALEIKRDTVIGEMKEKKKELESDLNAAVQSYENKRDTLFNEIETKIENASSDMESAIKNTENTLEEKLSDKEEDIEASLIAFSERLEEKEKRLEENLETILRKGNETLSSLEEKFNTLKSEMESSFNDIEMRRKTLLDETSLDIENKKKAVEEDLFSMRKEKDRIGEEFTSLILEKKAVFEKEIEDLEERRDQYKERCKVTLDEEVEKSTQDALLSLQKIKAQGDEFLKTVTRATGDSEKAYHILTETASGKVKEAEESLRDIRVKIKETENSLAEQIENVTKMKEEVWNLQQEEKTLQGEISSLKDEKTKLESDNKKAKSDRLNEEATLVRLKGQQKTIQREMTRQEEAPKKPTFEEVDIVTGVEEEVDVSDDDD